MSPTSLTSMGVSYGPEPYSVFTPSQKALIVAIISTAAVFSGLSSHMYFPAIPTIAKDPSVSELINLTVTSYLIFQGLSPSIWGAFADVHGRRVIYILTFIIYLGACIGLAETKNFYQLVILRCLQSSGNASTLVIGAGVGDITRHEERGGCMGVYQACTLLSPLGPF
jgi:MFS family permease